MKTARFLAVFLILFLAIGIQPIKAHDVDIKQKNAETKSEGAKKPGKIERGLLKAEKKINKAIRKTGKFGERTLKKVKDFGKEDKKKAETNAGKAYCGRKKTIG